MLCHCRIHDACTTVEVRQLDQVLAALILGYRLGTGRPGQQFGQQRGDLGLIEYRRPGRIGHRPGETFGMQERRHTEFGRVIGTIQGTWLVPNESPAPPHGRLAVGLRISLDRRDIELGMGPKAIIVVGSSPLSPCGLVGPSSASKTPHTHISAARAVGK